MSVAFPSVSDVVTRETAKVATQYREAVKYLGMVAAYLRALAEAAQAVDAIPEKFDLNTAVGDQLTLIGKRMGFGRYHCACVSPPVFGFPYPGGFVGTQIAVTGLCDSATWLACATGNGDVNIVDDEIYRRFLKARAYQIQRLFDVGRLQSAAQIMWGASARIHDVTRGSVTIAFGRDLTQYEAMILPLALRVMPIAPGIRPMVHYGAGPIFGFGTGWGGFCVGARMLCPVFIDPYGC